MKFKVTEVQTVKHTYTYTVEIPDDDLSYSAAMSEALCSAIPDDAEEESHLLGSEEGHIECLHANQRVDDRSQFICNDCGEELGR